MDRAGFRPVDRHEIVKEKSVEELNAQLVSLVGNDGAEMLIVLSKVGKAYQALSWLDMGKKFKKISFFSNFILKII